MIENPLDQKKRRTLNLGELIISDNSDEEVIWTVLGSCVSVIFHVPGQFSLICHSQLPDEMDRGLDCAGECPNPCFRQIDASLSSKYVKCSLEYMINHLRKHKVPFGALKTTIVGGANLMNFSIGQKSIGQKNIEMALSIFENHAIAVNRQYLGGNRGCSLWYFPPSNRLIIKNNNDNEKFELD